MSLLRTRFGELPDWVTQRLEGGTTQDIDRWGQSALSVPRVLAPSGEPAILGRVSTTTAPAIHLPEEILQRLQRRAAEEHCTVDELAAEVVSAFLDDAQWVRDVQEARASITAGRGLELADVATDLRTRARKIAEG
ncbi:MAG: hypothetical protein HY904_12600 [Deltaproteobacteria bacterium]|nr:hypothetical protein [Deltaproteobacteria bacterium]